MKSHPPSDDGLQDLWLSLRARALRRGADHHTAEDVAQDTWVRALEKPPEERGRFRAWMMTVSERVLSDAWRRQGHRTHREAANARSESIDRGEVDFDPSPIVRWVKDLPQPYAQVVWLRFFEDREVARIAVDLGRSEEAVRTQLRRGLDRLRARIGNDPESRHRFLGLAWIGALWRRGREYPLAAGLGLATVVVIGLSFLRPPGREPASVTAVLADTAPVAPDRPGGSTLVAGESVGSKEAAPSASQPEGGPLLTGRVLSPDGVPVAGAIVCLGPDGETIQASTTTGADGRYQLAHLDAALLWALHPGWLPAARCYLPSVRDGEIDLHLGATSGPVLVRVVDASGKPVAEARVLLDPFALPEQFEVAGRLEFPARIPVQRTGEDGQVELLFPAAPRVQVAVVSSDGLSWMETVSRPENGVLEVRLDTGRRLLGTCVDARGQPAPGARVSVGQRGGLVRREAVTDQEGRFEVTGLVPGAIGVVASEDPALGWASGRLQGFVDDGPVQLVLRPGHTLRGRLLDEGAPVTNALALLRVHLPEEGLGNEPRTTHTDEEGRFVFPGLAMRRAYSLELRPGEISRSATGQTHVGPMLEEQVFRLPEAALCAPAELEFEGTEEEIPLLVELRSRQTRVSSRLTRVVGTPRFVSDPLPEGEYVVFCWRSGLGAHVAGRIRHDPFDTPAHTVAAVRAVEVEVAPYLPPGIDPLSVTVSCITVAMDAFGLGSTGAQGGRHFFRWHPDTSTYRCLLPAGTCDLRVDGEGVASSGRQVRVEGETFRIDWPILAGRRVKLQLDCEDRLLEAYDTLFLDVQHAEGTTQIIAYNRDMIVEEGVATFDMHLPTTTTELLARVVPLVPEKARRAQRSPLAGGLWIDSTDLEGEDVPTLVVSLEPE